MKKETFDYIKQNLDKWTTDKNMWIDANGYYTCKLGGKNIRVHQIIAVLNGLDVIGKDIDHINGIKTDNRPENLEAVTHEENNKRAHKMGLTPRPKGIKRGTILNGQYNEETRQKIRDDYATGLYSMRELSIKYECPKTNIFRFIKNLFK